MPGSFIVGYVSEWGFRAVGNFEHSERPGLTGPSEERRDVRRQIKGLLREQVGGIAGVHMQH